MGANGPGALDSIAAEFVGTRNRQAEYRSSQLRNSAAADRKEAISSSRKGRINAASERSPGGGGSGAEQR